MLNEYLKENKISIYSLAKKSGVPYSSVNDLANGRVDVQNCKAGMLRSLAVALDLGMDLLYELCKAPEIRLTVRSGDSEMEAALEIRGKAYYTAFLYNNEPVLLRICPVNELNRQFIEDFAVWHTEAWLEQKRLEELTWKAC